MWSECIFLVALISSNYGQLTITHTEPALTDVDELRATVLQHLNEAQLEISESNNVDGEVSFNDIDMMRMFRRISKEIREVEDKLARHSLDVLEIMYTFNLLKAEIQTINDFYKTFIQLQNETVASSDHEERWGNYAQYYLNPSKNSINNTLKKIHELTVKRGREPSIFRKSLREATYNVCELKQSQQQVVYQLYSMIAVAELKGFTMLNFAWMLLKLYDKGNFTTEAELLRQSYFESTMAKVNAARDAMAGADRSLYKCDPKKWKEGENYLKVTQLLQGYIENEVNLNPDGTCRENCRYYQSAQYYGCYKDQNCARQEPCRGQVIQCTYVDSDMNICKSSTPGRRYDWIEYESGKILGKKGTCPNRITKVDSWWRYLFWHCSYCFCLCDDNHPGSDRYFSLKEATSDIDNGRVVTGVRFVKKNQVFHLQIQQGQLLERGTINKTTLEWVPISPFSILDNHVEDGIDYHTLTWLERAIDLDDTVAPADHALTGVRFRKLASHLNLEIRATPFNFNTGQVHPKVESVWLSNDNTDGNMKSPRLEVTIPNADLPTNRGHHTVDSSHDQYIKFKESSLSTDASQSTVPFIDAQPVESDGLVLSGVGIQHRGTYNSGGLIAPKLITFDFSSHMNLQTPVV